jgi:hypothetical protein
MLGGAGIRLGKQGGNALPRRGAAVDERALLALLLQGSQGVECQILGTGIGLGGRSGVPVQPVVELLRWPVMQHLMQVRLDADGTEISLEAKRPHHQLIPLLQVNLASPPYGRTGPIDIGLAAQIAQAEAAIVLLDSGMTRHDDTEPVPQLPVILLGRAQGATQLVKAVLHPVIAIELLAVEHHQGQLLIYGLHFHSCTQMVT